MRAVADVGAEQFEVLVQRQSIQADGAFAGAEVAGQHAQESTFAASTGTHHADQVTAPGGETDAIKGRLAVVVAVKKIRHFQTADQVSFFLNDAVAKVTAQAHPFANINHRPVVQHGPLPHQLTTDQNRTASLQNLHHSALGLIVAGNPDQQLTAGIRREQNVARTQQGRIVRDQIVRLAGRQRETPAHFPSPPTQFRKGNFRFVRKGNLVGQPSFQAFPHSQ